MPRSYFKSARSEPSKPGQRALVVSLRHDRTMTESELAAALSKRGWQVRDTFLPYGRRPARLISAFILAVRHVRNFELVVTSEYNIGFAFALASVIMKANCKNVIVGMNLSGKPLKPGFSIIDKTINYVFDRVNRVIVHSREEIDLFIRLHKLDPERVSFSPWGFDLPTGRPSGHAADIEKPYFCMVGRNNRDTETFVEALSIANFPGIIITDAAHRVKSRAENIKILYDADMDECVRYISNSAASVILVRDALRGAGHITAVMGMLASRPHIFTDVPTLRDYLVDGRHGIGVELGDKWAVAAAMKRIVEDEEEARHFGEIARRDALAFHSHAKAINNIVEIILTDQDMKIDVSLQSRRYG